MVLKCIIWIVMIVVVSVLFVLISISLNGEFCVSSGGLLGDVFVGLVIY